MNAEDMNPAFELAAQRGGFNWSEVDILAATRDLRTPILLIHGRRDDWIPAKHSESIKAAAPAGGRLLLGPGNHLTLSVRLDPIAEQVATWFDRGLAKP